MSAPRGRVAIGLPYVWLILFFLIPFLIVAVISLGESAIAIPPYTAPLEFGDDWLPELHVNWVNYLRLVSDDLYVKAYLNSLHRRKLAVAARLLGP